MLTGLVWLDLYWQFVLLQLLQGLRLQTQLLHFPLLSQGQHLYKKVLYIECFRFILCDIYISFILMCNKNNTSVYAYIGPLSTIVIVFVPMKYLYL